MSQAGNDDEFTVLCVKLNITVGKD